MSKPRAIHRDTRLQTRWELITYAFSRLPPRQLPLLAIYAWTVLYASKHKWINADSVGRAAQAIVSVLSMVTGLLLSYRFSTATSRWEEGKKVWVSVRTNIRDGIRVISVPTRIQIQTHQSSSGESAIDLGEETTSDHTSETGSIDSKPLEEEAEDGESNNRMQTRQSAAAKRSAPGTSTRNGRGTGRSPTIGTSRKSRSVTPQNRSTRDSDVGSGGSGSGSVGSSPWSKNKGKGRDIVGERTEELAGLLVGFAFALQHHLQGTRPLPQAPLIDLLPTPYLSSLKRTEARVRFAPAHAGPSGSGSLLQLSTDDSALSTTDDPPTSSNGSPISPTDGFPRPGIRRRGTGPPTKEERLKAGENDDDGWELSQLRDRAEIAVSRLADAVAIASGANGDGPEDIELQKQLLQLNLPVEIGRQQLPVRKSASHPSSPIIDIPFSNGDGTGGKESPIREIPPFRGNRKIPSTPLISNGNSPQSSPNINTTPKPKSNLANPYPTNLPLCLLKLMETYSVGLAEISVEQGGWTEPKRDRILCIVHSLGEILGNAERLASDPPPLPLTLHLSNLLMIYLAALPCALLTSVDGWKLVLVTMIAGWCLLGLEALVSEVGGVFGNSENHLPLPMLTREILLESIEISLPFARYYRNRLVSRLGDEDDNEIQECDRRIRRSGSGSGARSGKASSGADEWIPKFS